ncbi:hypothetical protein Poly59_13150 [Rubripirellula reticaptiva]|uniref:Transposase n=1 Tax=Rubripirellula reticaptiva TaxID=2528013 RepID=A0A5C6FDX2_9BACT|nr:hypothetical protein Poly59_13150 [Rubripirellula reticaptiva]
MLKTEIGWRDLPTELETSEKAIRRRLKSWTEQGLWATIFHQLLTRLRASGRLDLADVLVDSGLIQSPCVGEKSAPTRWTVGSAGIVGDGPRRLRLYIEQCPGCF